MDAASIKVSSNRGINMIENDLKQSLLKIKEALSNSDSVDEEALKLAQELELEIQNKLEESKPQDDLSFYRDLAVEFETKFESKHPIAASLVREVIDTLNKIGV